MGDARQLEELCQELKALPFIHINGSGKEPLREQYIAVYRQVKEAYDKACSATPHGRDYYPIGPNAGTEAREEYRVRVLEPLYAMCDYLEKLVIGITDGGWKREFHVKAEE